MLTTPVRKPVPLAQITRWVCPAAASDARWLRGVYRRYWFFGEYVVSPKHLADLREYLVHHESVTIPEEELFYIPREDLVISPKELLTDINFLDAPIVNPEGGYPGVLTNRATVGELHACGLVSNTPKWTRVVDLRNLYGLTPRQMKTVMEKTWEAIESPQRVRDAFMIRYLGGSGAAKYAYVTERVVRVMLEVIKDSYPQVDLTLKRPRPCVLPIRYEWTNRFNLG